MARNPRRADDPRPGSGFRLEIGGKTIYLRRDEIAGAAQVAQLQKALGAPQDEIAQAVLDWLDEYRQAKRFFGRK